jgi:hypothetical protein
VWFSADTPILQFVSATEADLYNIEKILNMGCGGESEEVRGRCPL